MQDVEDHGKILLQVFGGWPCNQIGMGNGESLHQVKAEERTNSKNKGLSYLEGQGKNSQENE